MAGPCIEYKGKQYSYAEFTTLLHDGELSNLVNSGVLKGFEDIPNELKVKNEAAPTRNTSANGNVQPRVEPMGESGVSKPKSPAKESVQPVVEPKPSQGANEVTLDDIQNFINETYLNDEKASPATKADQGAIEDSNEKNRAIPIVEKGRKQVRVTQEGKVSMQGRKSLAKRQFKGDRKTASEIDPTDATSLALKYFVNGGKVASDYFTSKAERQARTNGLNGIASKEAKTAKGRKATIDEIAHDIWESAENDKLNIDSRDIKNAVEDVVNGNLTVQNVVNSLLKSYNVEKEDLVDYERKYAEAFQEFQEEGQDYSEENIQGVASALDYLSDAEIVELANSEEKSFDDYVKDLESRQVTYDFGPFVSEKGTIQPDGSILSENGDLLSPGSVKNVKQVNPSKESQQQEGDLYEIIGKEDTILRNKQQKEIDEAKSDLDKIAKGDSDTISKYVKKSGYKLITKAVIEENNNPIFKNREGDYYKNTGATIYVETAKNLALKGATRKANSKATGISTARIEELQNIARLKQKTNTEETKKLSDKVRNLKIDLSRLSDGGLQSNPLGLPVGIWNVSMDIIATSIDAGMEIGEAIKKAIAYIEKNNKGVFDKIKFANVINNSLANNNIILNETTSLDLKQNKIRGRFLNEAQANKLQKEIESKYVTDKTIELFSKEKDDIRMAMFNYENPIAEKNSNGVNLRIATGLIRTNEEGVREKTYLLYADGKIVGEFYSVDDVKKVIKLIEDNLVKEIPELNSQQIKDNVNAEVDRIAQKVKDLLPRIKDPDVKLQGLSQDDLIDLVASAVKALISKGIDINDAIQQVVASIKERFNVDVDQDLVKEKLNITNIPQDFEREPGRKSVAGRMASGNSAIIKRAIANNSLDYEIENQKEAKEKADAFVDEVGFYNALIAVRDGLVDGGQGAFIYARAIEILEQEINYLKGEDKLDAVANYMKLLDEIAVELDLRSRKYGQFISALANIYYSSKGRYNLTKMVKDYKAANNGVISKEVLEKLKNVEEKLKESEAKLAELEAKKRIEEENEAFNNILESVARRKAINTNVKITDKQKAKSFADKLRSFKISNLGGTNVATPFSIAYDLAIEAAAQALELSGAISDAIKAGVESIRNANLSKDEQQQALSDLFDLFDDSDVSENTSQKGMMSINDEGMLRIPHSLIREKVENGVDNIEDLVSELMADVQELFPDSDFTERQVRDAVTGYGKISNPTSDEIETQISIIKSIGKIASGIEDANKGQRPLRSGQQRREPTMKERTEMKKLKALLRDLPLADADITKAYKTALDAIKKRLSNEIEELDEQIAKEKKEKERKA